MAYWKHTRADYEIYHVKASQFITALSNYNTPLSVRVDNFYNQASVIHAFIVLKQYRVHDSMLGVAVWGYANDVRTSG